MSKEYILLNECKHCNGLMEVRTYNCVIRQYCTRCKKWGMLIGNLTKKREGRLKRKKIKIDLATKEKWSLMELRTMDYNRYLKTGHWKRRRIEYYKTHEKICFCCEKESYVLHHCSYKNRGKEKDEDLIPLCEECHNSIHDLIVQEKDVNLDNGHIVKKQLLGLRF